MTHITQRQANLMSFDELMGYSGMGAPTAVSTHLTTSGTPTGSTTAPSPVAQAVITANRDIANLLSPFGPIIDHIPNPPYYRTFSADLKTRPIDAFVGLVTPLDWIIYDIIREANAASSVHAGSARRIGLPGHQVDFVMGQQIPTNMEPTMAAYGARLNALQQFLILAHQDPRALAKGVVVAAGKAVTAGRLSAQQKIDFLSALIQSAIDRGVALFHGVAEGVIEPDNRFIQALVDEIKSSNPALQILADAKRVFDQGRAAAQRAVDQAADAVRKLAEILPVIRDYNAMLLFVGPQNAGLVAEVYARGDSGIKNRAEGIAVRATTAKAKVMDDAGHSAPPPGIIAILNTIISNSLKVKNNASDAQGYKDNGHNLATALFKASLAGSNYQPDASKIIGLPTAFAGVDGIPGTGFRGLGVTGFEESLAAAAILGSGGAGAGATGITTTGTAGVATAPATTPGIAGIISQIIGMVPGASSIPGISNLTGGGTPTITTQPSSVTVRPGGAVTFSVAAAGQNLTYEWQAQAPGEASFTKIPDSTNSPSYAVGAGLLGAGQSGTKVRVKVCAGTACTTSDVATLTVSGAAVPGSTAKKTDFVPYILGAGALVALPVVGPVAALALAAGAALTATRKKPAGGSAGLAGVDGVDGANTYMSVPQPRVISLGASNPMDPGSDPLMQVATGAVKIKPGMSGAVVVAAKEILRLNGVRISDGGTWTAGDEAAIRSYQGSHGLTVSGTFDRDTLASLRAAAAAPSAPKHKAISNGAKAGIGVGLVGLVALALKK